MSALAFVILMALGALGEEYTSLDYNLVKALSPFLNPFRGLLLDSPASISNARTSKNKNKLPTLEQMKYYNYYAVSMYYGYDHDDLSCEYCLKFKNDVSKHEVLNNNDHNTAAVVTLSKKRKEIVIAFRGTWNVWNIVLDVLLVCGSNIPNRRHIKIHQGFYVATMSLYEEVVRTVALYLNDNPKFKVVITGHSLGGAMARLMYFFLEDNKQFLKVSYELYTYGEPRVGNKYFADFMNRQSITTARVVSRKDIFPHLPPTSVMGSKLLGDFYVHPQTEYWINDEKKAQFCKRTVYEDPKCSMSAGPTYSVLDHTSYFDTNMGSVLGQPLLFAYLPFSLLNPVDHLPPLPKPIENLIGGIASGVISAASLG